MGFLDTVKAWLNEEEPAKSPSQEYWLNRRRMAEQTPRAMDLQVRAIDSYTTYPGWSEQILAATGGSSRPWRVPTIREALGVPAIFRANALISNTTGMLGMEAFRKGVKLSDDDVPRLIKRPDPFRIPRDFYRDTAFHMASRGEFWWWIAARDTDDSPLSLIVVPPWEIRVEANQRDRLRPVIKWLDREMPNKDMRHGTFMLDESGLRGVGPLQLCGAAVSVAVESQEWAANFFSEDGGYPSLVIKTAGELGEDPETGVNEADTLRDQWMSKPHNTPRVIDQGIESVDEFGTNASSAAMFEGRRENAGEASRMYGIPGSLLEYRTAGSSLTYQNLTEEFTKFVRVCLAPDYLEPIEQHMSDLLTRSTVSRFAVSGFLRADVKTRWEVYKLATEVLGPEEAAAIARESEGIVPGDVEFAPVPFSPPQAFPERLPIQQRSAEEVRCHGTRLLGGVPSRCGKLLAESGPFVGTCPRCKKVYPMQVRSETATDMLRDFMDALPDRIASAIPRQEPPVVNIHEGAFRADVNIPPPSPMRRKIERDPVTGLALFSVEEPA